jgi:hypothetical protein
LFNSLLHQLLFRLIHLLILILWQRSSRRYQLIIFNWTNVYLFGLIRLFFFVLIFRRRGRWRRRRRHLSQMSECVWESLQLDRSKMNEVK